MTTSSETFPAFYRLDKKRKSTSRLLVCALAPTGKVGGVVPTAKLRWSAVMAGRLRAINDQGRDSGRPEGRSLPYASLRAALQTKLPEAIILAPDLGAPWKRNESGLLLTAEGGTRDQGDRATQAVALWIQMILRPWAENIGVDEALVDAAAELADAGRAFDPVDESTMDLGAGFAAQTPFRTISHAILQVVARRLQGRELFPGLGPVHRVVCRRSADNAVEFITWPTIGKDGARYSMCAHVSVETAPFLKNPILVVSAKRRRWLASLPDPKRTRMQSSLRGFILSRSVGPSIAVEFTTDVEAGVVSEPFSPEYLMHALAVRADLAAPLSEMVARQEAQDVFVGIPRASSAGKNGGGSGSSTRDHSDLLDVAASLLKDDGFEPLSFNGTSSLKMVPRRAQEHHRALAVEALLADVGLQLGRNDLDEATFREAWAILSKGDLPPKLDYAAASKVRSELEEVREGNRERVRRAFGDLVPRVVLVAATADERTTLRACVDALFGRSISVVEHQLPRGVHDQRSNLGLPRGKAKERFSERVTHWQPLAQALAREGIPNHVLVQAADWYGSRKDDPVNKLAGRYALAASGDANVQYLRPPGERARDFANYLHRVQAAIYDLLFGHSGLVSEIGSLLTAGFPNAATRPKSVIGISVVAQSRTRTGAQGGRLCLATRIDADGSETTARVGWFQGAMTWSPDWMPQFKALKLIASPDVNATLGNGREVESASFQAFVKTIVDEAVQDGDRPLVMVDSTSAASLWPSLTDEGMSDGLRVGREQVDASVTWRGARLVRVRVGRAARMIEAKTRYYERIDDLGRVIGKGASLARYCPTITERTVRISQAKGPVGTHYWMTHGYFQMSFPRGLSVYRVLPALMPAKKLKVAVPKALQREAVLCERQVDISDETYRVPRPIDVTVALMDAGDDPDRIAHVVASLRHGYGHTAATTTLPAPLSFESKARDYMTRFALDEADLDEDGSADADEPPEDIEIDGSETEGEPGPSRDWRGLDVDVQDRPHVHGTGVALPTKTPDPVLVENQAHDITGEGGTGIMKERETDTGSIDQIWSDFSREPVLPVPAFVTAEWLKPYVSAPNALIRSIHEWRGEIEALSGFPGWPDHKPSSEEFHELLVEGLRYPCFLRAVIRAAMRAQTPKKRPEYQLLAPLRKIVTNRLLSLSRGKGLPPSMVSSEALVLLCDNGSSDLAAGTIYFITLGNGVEPGFRKFVESQQGIVGDLLPFITAAEQELKGDFEWKRDLVGLRGSPSSPPVSPKKAPVIPEEGSAREVPSVTGETPADEIPASALARTEGDDVPAGYVGLTEGAAEATSAYQVEVRPPGQASVEAALTPGQRWKEAMDVVWEIALSSPDPSAEIVRRLREAVIDVRRAYKDWDAAQPKLIDATELAAEVRRITGVLGLTVPGHLADLGEGRVLRLPADDYDGINSLIFRIQSLHGESIASKERAQELMKTGELTRIPEIIGLGAEGDARHAEAVDGLSALLARLEELSVHPNTAPATPPQDVGGGTPSQREHPSPEASASDVSPGDVPSLLVDPTIDDTLEDLEAPHTSAETTSETILNPATTTEPTGTIDDLDPEDPSLELIEELSAEDQPDLGPHDSPTTAAEKTGEDREGIRPADAAVEAPVNHLVERIEGKLVRLVASGEHGLAYHLVRAAHRSFTGHEFAFDADELRLIAMAPYAQHAAMQGSQLLATTIHRVFDAVGRTASPDEGGRSDLTIDVRQARRLVLFGAASALVLFHPDTMAGQLLSALRSIAPDVDPSLYPLRDALVDASRSRLTLTPAMFRAVNVQAAGDRYTDSCRDDIINKVDAIGRLQFRFQLGTKIRSVLVRGEGVLGRLQDAVRANGEVGLEAARTFAKDYGDRGAVIDMLEAAEGATGNRRVQGIDGEARERLVANVAELVGLCLSYVQAREATPAMNVAGKRALVQNMRVAILAGLERALPALSSLVSDGSDLTRSAATFTLEALQQLRGALDGRMPQVGPYDHLLAVHGALAWVPGLRFGTSWLPCPYEADTVVARLLQVDPSADPSTSESFESAVRLCMREDRYIAAWMLIDQGTFKRIDPATTESMRLMIEANARTRRDKLIADVAEAKRSVERVQRLGALVGADDGQDLLAILEGIQPERVPDRREPDARTETEERETILDFSAAQDLLDDVVVKVGHLLDRPRDELLARLDALVVNGSTSIEDAGRVRRLVDKDDLLTAGEYLDFIANGRGLHPKPSANPRFNTFFPAVPNHLTTHGNDHRSRLRDAILNGEDVGPLAFSSVPTTRRDDAARVYDDWLELARRVQAGTTDLPGLMALLCSFLDVVGLKTELAKPDGALSNARRKVHVAEMRLRIEQDSEGVLLPEFGSLTGGNYRVVLIARMPTEADLNQLCSNAGAQGVIVLVMETVSPDRRRQLAHDSIKSQRKLLVVDEAIVLFSLSEREPRPLTLIECAQPFSFASPYRDYGNQPVPQEIFFGRETEYRKLVEPSGSCIVYGGRRLGKSALLQHIRAREHAPKAGTAVAYVNIYPIGNNALPKEIWSFASEKLPDVFGEPATTPAKFREGVMRWLDGDSRRRILVLFDEADRFIVTDANDGYREFIPLQGLMDATGRRFKFVLAGLHNVTRLVHTENPPLKQIASEPQRIGPLMNEELRDAELLVTRPLAALGYEFQNREDVWRILSHCNYYPVLVQTFCKGLLDALMREAEAGRRILFPITEQHVMRALANESISNEIGMMFDHTLKIDDRYDLIANIMADRSLRDAGAGRVVGGMTSVDIMEAAARSWPTAFTQNHRLSIIEDLLDEMEGLGVLRRSPDDTWALRSGAILRLLGNEAKITTRLLEFLDKPAPVPFEPRSLRRELRLPSIYKVPAGHSSPLTLGQEHDLVSLDASASIAPIYLIFGNGLSDIAMVAPAMTALENGLHGGQRAVVVARQWATAEALLEDFRSLRSDASRVLFVVDRRSEWNHLWVDTLLRSRSVREGRLAVAFAGGPEHALRWVTLPRNAFPPSHVKLMPLQLWSSAMIEHQLAGSDVPPAQYVDELHRLTGGFNRPMTAAIGTGSIGYDRLQARLERQHEKLLGDKTLRTDLGLIGPMMLIFETMLKWSDGDGSITFYEVVEGVMPASGNTELDARMIVDFGLLMGLLDAEASAPGATEEARRYRLNPLLVGALRSMSIVQAAE